MFTIPLRSRILFIEEIVLMARSRRRRTRERRTLRIMLEIYCRGNHGKGSDLCERCSALEAYALRRLDACPFGEEKPACSHCPVHCYKADMREQIRDVMKYAGPRMLARHPVLSLLHMLDIEKKSPACAHEEKK
ncbi:MAG: nitrous oxide-stimulated promoter family protein [Bacteriovoracaceae bacterium]|nr:nitrous oxide-stimulated promoter family protein [Deltaproteobacteria bacterium]NLW69198.1 nitrous oxide-stimulated promoter family protein [Bacteriovoracaceae bacterium]